VKKISVVVPVYQNALNIPATYKALKGVLDKLSSHFEYELIFVNDGSTDGSMDKLLEVHRADPGNVRIVDLLRNFGQVAAMMAGFRHASGDAVVAISADLQDPPALIEEMVKEWSAGSEIVIAVRGSREDKFLDRLASKFFYSLIRKFALSNMPTGGFDFFLIDRVALETVLRTSERNIFIQGQFLWPGYSTKTIFYKRQKRALGHSQWHFSKRIKYLIDGFVGYSFFPIRLASLFGVLMFILGIIVSLVLVWQRVFYGTRMAGWSSIMIALFFLSGLQMLMLGILGEYLWRCIEQMRGRPLYLVRRTFGVERQQE
jgi:polyisoprenyl-phosphate glycosyltransferase